MHIQRKKKENAIIVQLVAPLVLFWKIKGPLFNVMPVKKDTFFIRMIKNAILLVHILAQDA